MAPSPAIRIAVVGGGPAGIAFLALLNSLRRSTDFRHLDLRPALYTDRIGNAGFKASGTLWESSVAILQRYLDKDVDQWIEFECGGQWMTNVGYRAHTGEYLGKPSVPLSFGKAIHFQQGKFLELMLKHVPEGQILSGHRLEKISEVDGEVTLSFEGKEDVQADIIVGADGKFSKVRQCLHGNANVCLNFRGYEIFRGIANSSFTDNDSFQTWGPGARFATVPLRGKQSWFATIKCEKSKLSFGHDETAWTVSDAQKNALLRKFDSWHHPISAIIESTPANEIIRESVWGFPPEALTGFSTSRCTLIGDAAHCVDPVLAQGIGLAIEDAEDLLSRLMKLNVNEIKTFGALSMFKDYEYSRLRRVEMVRKISDISQVMGLCDSKFISSIRNRIMLSCPDSIKKTIFDQTMEASLNSSRGNPILFFLQKY